MKTAERLQPKPPPKGYVLRAAATYDAAPIAALHASRFPKGWSATEISGFLSDPHIFAHVAECETDGARPAGFVIARAAGGEAEILSLATAQDHERCGIASALVETSCRTAVRLGVQMVFLEVAAANTAARQLYERSGFCEIARRPRYYGPRKDADALILRLNLSAPVDGIAAAL